MRNAHIGIDLSPPWHCVYITDALCWNAVRVDGRCFPGRRTLGVRMSTILSSQSLLFAFTQTQILQKGLELFTGCKCIFELETSISLCNVMLNIKLFDSFYRYIFVTSTHHQILTTDWNLNVEMSSDGFRVRLYSVNHRCFDIQPVLCHIVRLLLITVGSDSLTGPFNFLSPCVAPWHKASKLPLFS